MDPFDLPEWLGVDEVTWATEAGVRTSGHLVPGRLTSPDEALPCDLLAVDEAYPAPVADEVVRRATHQAWRHGQVHLVEREGRLTLAVPGAELDAERALDAISRLARAVGASPERYAVLLRIGASSPQRRGAAG
ncbi:hypothetical protein GCM10027026_10900 [Myroides odoratimimus subsp. xuanwuensis]